jgi:Protein of unknwon function (DUF3008)
VPAESEPQRRAAAAALAAKHGHLKPRKGGAVQSMMSMSDEQLREFSRKAKKS